MTHMSSLSGRFVFTLFLAAFLLPAQEETTWDTNFKSGMDALAAAHYDDAAQFLTAALAATQTFSPLDIRRVDTAHLLAMSYQFQGKFDRAEPLYLQAKKILEEIGEPGRKVMGYTLDGLGQLRFEQGRWDEAETLERQAMELCRDTRGERDLCTLTAMRHLGELLSARGNFSGAAILFRQVIDAGRRQQSFPAPLLAASLRGEANIQMVKGHYMEAESSLKEALDLSSKFGDTSPEVADSLLPLARLYRLQQNAARAEPLLKRAATIYERSNDPCLAYVLQERGLIAISEKKYAIAKEDFLGSISIYQRYLGSDHISVALGEVGLAAAYLGEKNYDKAASLIEGALAKETKTLSESHYELAQAHMLAARIKRAQRDNAEADAHYRQALDIYRRAASSNGLDPVVARRQYEGFSKSFRK